MGPRGGEGGVEGLSQGFQLKGYQGFLLWGL